MCRDIYIYYILHNIDVYPQNVLKALKPTSIDVSIGFQKRSHYPTPKHLSESMHWGLNVLKRNDAKRPWKRSTGREGLQVNSPEKNFGISEKSFFHLLSATGFSWFQEQRRKAAQEVERQKVFWQHWEWAGNLHRFSFTRLSWGHHCHYYPHPHEHHGRHYYHHHHDSTMIWLLDEQYECLRQNGISKRPCEQMGRLKS